VFQSGFLETPLMPGSCSIWGTDPMRHWNFASEVCAERLVRKYVHPSGRLAWDWATLGDNHFCDVGTGIFAVASWFRLYDALPRVLDAAAAKAPPSADLFDPLRNPSINAGLAPYDEGYVPPPEEPKRDLPTLDEWRRRQAAPPPKKKHAILRRAPKRWVRK
jgi:hypothetical protein